MISYAETDIFNKREQYVFHRATELVAAIPDDGTVWRYREVIVEEGS